MKDKRTMFYGASPKIFEQAKALRDKLTKHELLLWGELKSNKLLGLRFKPQHPIGSFIADFYCHKLKLVIEIDGTTHSSVEAREYDNGREEEMSAFGIVTLRFTNEEVESNMSSILNEIKETCIHLAENQLIPPSLKGQINKNRPITPALKGVDDLNLKQSITPALKGESDSNQPLTPTLKGEADFGSIESPLQGVGGKNNHQKDE